MTKIEFVEKYGNCSVKSCSSVLHIHVKDWTKKGNTDLEKDIKLFSDQKIVDVIDKIEHHLDF